MAMARHFHRPGVVKDMTTISHAEDSQPNESIDKRRPAPSLAVPQIRSSRGKYKSRGGFTPRDTPNRSRNFAKPPNAPRPYPGMYAGSGAPIPIPVPKSTPTPIPREIRPPTIYQSTRVSWGPALSLPGLGLASARQPHHEPTRPMFETRRPNSPPPLKRQKIDSVSDTRFPVSLIPPIATLGTPAPPSPPVKNEELPVVIPHARSPSPRDQRKRSLSPVLPIKVKVERRTPSPPPRRAATTGSQRYFPVPHNCTRADPDYVNNRRSWAQREIKVLQRLGLHVDRFFFRDDGMVVEWTSEEEVWLDTLRPVHERPRIPPPEEHEIIDVDAEPDDAAPHPPLPNSPSPAAVTPDEPVSVEEIDVPSVSRSQEDIEAFVIRMEQLSEEYLRRYISTFDYDREALIDAYAEDAVLSVRDNNFASSEPSTTFLRARTSQKNKMPRLSALETFRYAAPGGYANVDYEVLVLDQPESLARGDLPPRARAMLSVHGQLVGGRAGGTLAMDQTFLLEENHGGKQDGWPLVAVLHQMVVRDSRWERYTKSLAEVKAQGRF